MPDGGQDTRRADCTEFGPESGSSPGAYAGRAAPDCAAVRGFRDRAGGSFERT